MPNVEKLAELAATIGLNFTGFLKHDKIQELARAWLPDVNFHELEMFHSIDLEDLYTVPADVFFGTDPDDSLSDIERQEFLVEVGEVPVPPPVLRIDSDVRGNGESVRDALLEEDVHFDAVYTHGGNVRAADRFFGSQTDEPGVENPTLPRRPIRVRTEFRMLLETLKQDLALSAEADANGTPKPVDAIWGDFDVTDLLLRRINAEGRDIGPASRSVRHTFARDLIAAFESDGFFGTQALLSSPPPDGFFATRTDETVWLALTTCGLLEYHFIYAYNDFHRYGGIFTNEHEGDNEGCCLVFERERLRAYQDGLNEASAVAPLGLITSAHEPADRADDSRSVDSDPGDARDGLNVYVALGSHATYLTPGEHDFFNLSNLFRKEPLLFTLGVIAALAVNPLLIPLILVYSHFKDTKDKTSEDGVTGQAEVNPVSDPTTHLLVDQVVTPLSIIGGSASDVNIYDLTLDENPDALALRAFRGRLGDHDGFVDKSSKWENKTRRYFVHLVRALKSGTFRDPMLPIIVE